jgi:diacylglycerol kinase (ATP)
MSNQFKFSGRIRSFKFAIRGIIHMLKSQHNAWIHLVATIVTIAIGIILDLNTGEWCWVVLAITSVWAAEAMNTAFEFLCDATTKNFHPLVGQAKDVAAGAVLLTAIGSAVIGVIIFIPKIVAHFSAK